MNFQDKVVMITGSARGQGRVHAKKFAELGAKLILCDVCADIDPVQYALGKSEELFQLHAELQEQTHNQVITACVDIRNVLGIQKLVNQGIDNFGRIDVLVNNAGVCSIKPAWKITPEDWDVMLGVNLTGTWNVCQAVMPFMMEQSYGRIVNISSIAGLKGIPNLVHYTAAKHGVVGLTKALAIDLAPYSITVNCVCPGSVDTELLVGLSPEIGLQADEAKQAFASKHLLPGLISPQDINELVVWLASDAARSVTGVAWNIDRGWLQHH